MGTVDIIREKEKIAEALAIQFSMKIEEAQHFVSYLSRKVIAESGYLIKRGAINDKLFILFEGNAMAMYRGFDEVKGFEGFISWISNQIGIINQIPIDGRPVIVDESIWLFKGTTIYYMDFNNLVAALERTMYSPDFYIQQIHLRFDLVRLRPICYSRPPIIGIRLFNHNNPEILNGDQSLPYKISPIILATYFLMDIEIYYRALKLL